MGFREKAVFPQLPGVTLWTLDPSSLINAVCFAREQVHTKPVQTKQDTHFECGRNGFLPFLLLNAYLFSTSFFS